MKYTYELLQPIIKDSFSWADVCRKLNVKPFTGAQTYIKSRAIKFNIDFSHFTGQGWAKGKPSPKKKNINEYLVKGKINKTHRLRQRLIKEGLKKKECEKCGLSSWLNEEPPLELDHINSDITDCRLENLQILCANCHAIKTRNGRLVERKTR